LVIEVSSKTPAGVVEPVLVKVVSACVRMFLFSDVSFHVVGILHVHLIFLVRTCAIVALLLFVSVSAAGVAGGTAGV